jgi:hypothetical protein
MNFELHVRSCQNALLPALARARVWIVIQKNPMVNVEGDRGIMEEGRWFIDSEPMRTKVIIIPILTILG